MMTKSDFSSQNSINNRLLLIEQAFMLRRRLNYLLELNLCRRHEPYFVRLRSIYLRANNRCIRRHMAHYHPEQAGEFAQPPEFSPVSPALGALL